MSAVRPRPTLLPCTACGAARFLRVTPVREHGAGGEPTAMAARWVTRPRQVGKLARAVSCVGPKLEHVPHGTFTLLLCEACGDARWYARGLDDDPAFVATGASATVGDCADCGDRLSLDLGRVKTRGHAGQPSDLRVVSWPGRRWGFTSVRSAGTFTAFVCRGCERVTWVASGLDDVPASLRGTTPAEPCRRCRHTERLTVDPVNEDGATLRVVYAKQHLTETRIGRYSLSICSGCGVTDWSAHDISDLRPEPALGVARLEAAEGSEGPYR